MKLQIFAAAALITLSALGSANAADLPMHAPAYAPPPGQQTYAPPPGQQAYAPPAQSPPPEPNTVGSFRQSYAGFLQMFRDPLRLPEIAS